MALTFKVDQYRTNTVESNITFECCNWIVVYQILCSPFCSVELLLGNRWSSTRGPFSASILVSQEAERKQGIHF